MQLTFKRLRTTRVCTNLHTYINTHIINMFCICTHIHKQIEGERASEHTHLIKEMGQNVNNRWNVGRRYRSIP